jgi:hypothetical protein
MLKIGLLLSERQRPILFECDNLRLPAKSQRIARDVVDIATIIIPMIPTILVAAVRVEATPPT